MHEDGIADSASIAAAAETGILQRKYISLGAGVPIAIASLKAGRAMELGSTGQRQSAGQGIVSVRAMVQKS